MTERPYGHPLAKLTALFAVVVALFVVIGGLVGEFLFGSWFDGLAVALGLSAVLNAVSFLFADRIVLWSTHARLVTAAEAPRLSAIVDELAPKFGLERPRLAIVPTATPNAFATGRDDKHAVVAATEGILQQLNDRELRGVIAHELAHVRDRDMLLITFAATLAGAISYAAQMVFFSMLFGGGGGGGRGSQVNPILLLLAVITAPIAAMLLQLAISRSREYRADERGARTIRDPEGLASALRRLEQANLRRPMNVGSPSQASLYIVNPFRGHSLVSLFSTHPPIEERIRRLHAMAQEYTYRPPTAPAEGAPLPRRGVSG